MDQILGMNLEPGPDGHGWWPQAFATDHTWTAALTDVWQPVPEHPTLTARRRGDLLDLHQQDESTTHAYALTSTDVGADIASKETP